MNTGKLTITIRSQDAPPTIYRGEAEWRTDATTMELVSGPPLAGFDPGKPRGLEVHAFLCRKAALAAGLDTVEEWEGEFRGGHLR